MLWSMFREKKENACIDIIVSLANEFVALREEINQANHRIM